MAGKDKGCWRGGGSEKQDGDDVGKRGCKDVRNTLVLMKEQVML